MSAPLPNIILTGMMGTGKSAAGRALARLLGRSFMDTDDEIERRAHRTALALIREEGWAAFRALEAEVIQDLAVPRGLVVATGGGALLKEPAREAAARGGTVICLHAPPEILATRLTGQDRPLLEGAPDREAKIRQILSARAPVYESFALRLDTSTLTSDGAADALARLLGLEPVTVRIPGAPPCPIVIRRGLLVDTGVYTAWLEGVDKVHVIADRAPWQHMGPALTASLANAGKLPRIHLVSPDEKSWEGAGRLLDGLAAAGAARDHGILVVGGGATLDLGSFVASVYMRGLRTVLIPTTLLAMIDAAIGGKTAVDHRRARNLAGTFYSPRGVLADPDVLATLPESAFSDAFSEALKTALIGDDELFTKLAEESTRTWREEGAAELIRRCARVKARVVSEDPRELGLRQVLNLGHTTAHALEALDPALTHGQAVGLGLLAAARIGQALGHTEPGLEGRIRAALTHLGLPTTYPAPAPDAFMDRVRLDKKRVGERIRLVIPHPPRQGGDPGGRVRGDLRGRAERAGLRAVSRASAHRSPIPQPSGHRSPSRPASWRCDR
ncbi:MAG: bifunctional shikimate kinase/3-dehydroquinate synthase [Pseudomonadota bacterium]